MTFMQPLKFQQSPYASMANHQYEQPERQPGLLDSTLQGFGGGLGEGIAGGLRQEMRKSMIEKTLGMLNPKMSVLEKYDIISKADPETQAALMPRLKIEQEMQAGQQKQQANQAFAQALENRRRGGISQNGQQSQSAQYGTQQGNLPPVNSQQALELAKMDQAEEHYVRSLEEKRRENRITAEEKISIPILEKNEGEREATRLQGAALENAELALQNKDLSFFSPDNLAELLHVNAFRSPEGALFKTAIKENLIGGMSRIGASAAKNQWIEKQLYDMGPQIGSSNAANQSIIEALKSDVAVRQRLVQTRDELADKFRKENGFVPANINRIADDIVRPFAEKEQKKLAYRIQELRENETKPELLGKLVRVKRGTPLTVRKAKIILDKVNGNKEMAMKVAKDAGYDITDLSTIEGME